MNLLDYANLGGVIFTVAALVFIIKEFLKFTKHQEDNFARLIENHLHTDTEAKNNLKESHNRLAFTIEQLMKWLQQNNGRKQP